MMNMNMKMKGGFGSRVVVGEGKNDMKMRSVVKDEDLSLFRDLNNRNGEKDRIISLLHPLSDELFPNPNGTDQLLHRIPSARKGSSALDFLAENDKHDYDWLKTPPATPLFPSIEMEAANSPHVLPIQRQITVLQPLTRFADGNNNKEASCNPNSSNRIQKSLIQKPKPKSNPKPVAAEAAATTTMGVQRSSAATLVPINKNTNIASKSKESNNSNFDSVVSNKMMSTNNNKPMRSRAVSPLVRSTLMISGLLSNETPPNLRTVVADDQRSTSAMRGRAATPTSRPRRQSCSPSVARGRKPHAEATAVISSSSSSSSKVEMNKGTGGVMGSRMVDKVMNARRSAASTNNTNNITTSARDHRFKDHTKQKYSPPPSSSMPNLLTPTTTTTTTTRQDQIQTSALGFGRIIISKTSARDKTRSN